MKTRETKTKETVEAAAAVVERWALRINKHRSRMQVPPLSQDQITKLTMLLADRGSSDALEQITVILNLVEGA